MGKKVMKTENRKRISTVVLTIAMTAAVALGVMLFTPARAMAAEKFDPVYYLMNYPDVGMALGAQLSEETLYDHYINYGMAEGRKAYAGAAGGEAVDGISEGTYSGPAGGIVPLKELPDYNDLKDAMTDAEFEELYHWSVVTVDGRIFIVDPCLGIVTPTEDKYAHPLVDYIISRYGMR